MNTLIQLLQQDSRVSGYKINVQQKESYELFFVKGKLETVRCTDNCNKEVTLYVDHDGFKGDAQFFVYPSTTDADLERLIGEAVAKALLINNQNYQLPDAQQGDYVVESNFSDYTPAALAELVANTVFAANTVPNASLNSVEVFVNKHTQTILNSRGLHKTQVSYDAMVEAIPTYNGAEQSVELYEQYNFSTMDVDAITREIAEQMNQVKARYDAVKPDFAMNCTVILNKQELASLFAELAGDLNYASVYSRSNLFQKGDLIQKDPKGDKISLTMAGEAPGCVRSAKFDADGLSLDKILLVDEGKAVNYYGSNRFGQYLNETPTGALRCMLVAPGSGSVDEWKASPYLEVISMSGLQVDLNTDYIGGEIRLAYYYDGNKVTPITGVSISGVLSDVLSHIRLSAATSTVNGYVGPEQAALQNMQIF